MTFPPAPPPQKGAPRLSRAPWAGYSPREHARPVPLPVCPSPRCRRLKACVAAHDGLFCQRTHVSDEEWTALHPPEFRWRLKTKQDLALYRIYLEYLAEEQKIAFEDLQERWKAGEFDHLYGKYKARGVVLRPPEKVYREQGAAAPVSAAPD